MNESPAPVVAMSSIGDMTCAIPRRYLHSGADLPGGQPGLKPPYPSSSIVMETGIPIFRQVEVTIVVAENDTPI